MYAYFVAVEAQYLVKIDAVAEKNRKNVNRKVGK